MLLFSIIHGILCHQVVEQNKGLRLLFIFLEEKLKSLTKLINTVELWRDPQVSNLANLFLVTSNTSGMFRVMLVSLHH